MISVYDLIRWADAHAVGRSPYYPKGWVHGKDLVQLGVQIERLNPMDFYFSLQNNLAEEGER